MARQDIRDLIGRLKDIQAEHGDLEVVVDRDGVRVPMADHWDLRIEPEGEGYDEDRDQVIL